MKSPLQIAKAVIPAAGLGTRLLSATKEQPKEMLPIFSRSTGGALSLKPMLQLIFEQLFDSGIREFCFVVGREKRVLEDHFTPDHEFISRLNGKAKGRQAAELEGFYEKVETSSIVWVNQPHPMGFGHAVLMAKPFVSGERFLVHAGDTYIIPQGRSHLQVLADAHASSRFAATLLLQRVKDTTGLGLAVTAGAGESMRVKRVVEKPAKPPSDLAIMPVYVFERSIIEALERTRPGVGGEVQLTDGIQRLIDEGLDVGACVLAAGDRRLDIGTPETYWDALRASYGERSVGAG